MLHERYYIEQEKLEKLIAKKNQKSSFYNGIFDRYENPVLTRAHIPVIWKYDLDSRQNPWFMERLGVNAVMNSGAIELDGRYYLVVRVEGNDRKSFFAVAESETGTEGFRFRDYPLELPDTYPEETNVYDMRMTKHEDGYIYGVFCSESKDHTSGDLSAAVAAAGIVRTKDMKQWERLDNLKTLRSPQQRNVVLHPEFVDGKYAFYTRPMDGFIDTGSGGGIGFGLCEDICHAVIDEEQITSERKYHTITEAKNGAGAVPIKGRKGWLHIAHGVRNTAAGLRYVLYTFATDLKDPSKVIAEPSGMFLGPVGAERVGDVSNVVFTNGAIVKDNGEVYIYYASCDTRMHVAVTTLEKLEHYMFHTPEDPLRSADCVKQRAELIQNNLALLKLEQVYKEWSQNPCFDKATREELAALSDDRDEIYDRFYRELEFGTGGLRGIIGAGTNRINKYTIRKATQGLASYIRKQNRTEMGVAVACDSRYMSEQFALEAALCLCANGIKVYLYESLRPTPMLSFALRELGCTAGIVITASHNPAEYNGYKVYWQDGAQITSPRDREIIAEVQQVKDFSQVQMCTEAAAVADGLLHKISGEIDDKYIAALQALVLEPEAVKAQADQLKIVYTPLHGAGNIPVQNILEALGFAQVYVVAAQQEPDGRFPTVPYPNPEEPAAFRLALELAKEVDADLVLATDPDADRLGVHVKDEKSGEYIPFTGNMSGILMCEYELERRHAKGLLPKDGTIVSTIVSTNMACKVAEAYGVHYEETLTGFKYIGEYIRKTELTGRGTFLFGFEESYGCLVGTHARDKDAVASAMVLCEAAAWYRSQGSSLNEQMERLYEKYGYYQEVLFSQQFGGAEGAAALVGFMAQLRAEPPVEVGGCKVLKVRDYSTGKEPLPKSDVLYFELEDDGWFCVRPSGTEPKVKYYAGVRGKSREEAGHRIEKLAQAIRLLAL